MSVDVARAKIGRVGVATSTKDGLGLFNPASTGESTDFWDLFLCFFPKTSPTDMVLAAPKASETSATFHLLPISSKLLAAYSNKT